MTMAITKKTLRDSKLYQVTSQVQLLDSLVPNIDVLVTVETYLAATYPREEDGSDLNTTRIFIHYTNKNGNSSQVLLTDSARLDNTFDIDTFMDDSLEALVDDKGEDPILITDRVIRNQLTFGTMAIVGLEDSKIKVASQDIVRSLIATVYNDPLDVYIFLGETKSPNSDDYDPSITAAFVVHPRKNLE